MTISKLRIWITLLDDERGLVWEKHEKALGIQRKRRTIFSGRSMSERLQDETTFEEKICSEHFLVKGQSGLYIHRRKVKDEGRRACSKSSVSGWRGPRKD